MLGTLKRCIFSTPHSRSMTKVLNVISEAAHYKTPVPQKVEFLPPPLYGGRYMVSLLVGNGVGGELMKCVKDVVDEGRTPITFEEIAAPKCATDCDKDLHHIKTSIRRNRVALKGCIETEDQGAAKSQFNLTIKSELDLYVSIVHCKPYSGVKCLNPNLDLILARQNTEGEYFLLEHETVKGNVESLKFITKKKTERYAKWALHYARACHRHKVTIVHKRDVYPLSDGLFIDTIKEQARDFKDLRFDTMRLSHFIESLLKRPQILDFVMLPNLYGCAATNIACGLLGGAGLFSKKSFSDYYAVFEPAVGSLAKELVGKNVVNPVAMLNALRDMLVYLKINRDATAIDCAIRKTLSRDKIHTADIGGDKKTSEFMDRVTDYIRNYFCTEY
ncbi:isocitrate dehydrogenase [NAD] subunit gamma, mitochondrial-like [Harmonia axyridis]|uniref:isocitrate dehydrogenase [NAD] subunit gamma, mitochondrial-like n=1 Tax=Harmonia axyridis TaxID=115357 RepID=UPI001E278777|nr:isocitrate dehydrogenase [NAD] subunit gamma, mitochondrial-like [Harmonia axyridis]